MKKKKKSFLGILLGLTLMLGFLPGISLTAKADSPQEELLVTITATGENQASYSVENIATVTFGGSTSYEDSSGWWGYGWSATVSPAAGYTITRCVFYNDVNTPFTDDSSPFKVETPYTQTLYVNGNPISGTGIKKIEVYGLASDIAVTGVSISPDNAQTINMGNSVAFTANVSPDNATDKTVQWSVSGDSVKLYSDSECTTEVATGAVSALTVYAKGISAGDATVTVTTNDQDKTASCSVTVSKGNQTVTAPTAVTGLVYDGTAKTLVTAATVTTGNTASGSISYSLDNTSWSTSLPQGTNAGNYTVFYKVAGNNNYNEFVCSAPVSVTIAKSDPDAPTGLTAVVGQTLANVTLPEGWTWADSSQSVSAAGDNTFKANFDGNDNYNSASNVDVTVTVSEPPVTPVINITAGGGETHTIKKDDALQFTFVIAGHDADTYQAFVDALNEDPPLNVVSVSGKNYTKALTKDTDYIAEPGSLKLTLTKDYLDSLQLGDYTVTVKFKISGSVYESSSTFKIASSGGSNPGTGESNMIIVSAMILFILSLSVLMYMAVTDKLFREKLLVE